MVYLRRRSQAKNDQEQAAEALLWLAAAQLRAKQAAAQLAPLAAAAAANARRGVYQARTWTAPRLEQTGVALQEQVAPKMAEMLSTAAHRVEPVPPPPPRRRWPLLTLGFVTAAGLAIAAFLRSRRGLGFTLGDEAPDADLSPSAPSEPTTEATGTDVDGRVAP